MLQHENVPRRAKQALQQLMVATANVPGTEGHKVALRHLGHSMTMIFGPAVLFITFNFADLYSPLCLWLDDGPSAAGAQAVRLRIRCDDPRMPSLREMKQRLAKNPRALAKFFLLMQELGCRHLLGIDDLHIGKRFIQPSARLPRDGSTQNVALREDSFAASGGPSLVGFPMAAFGPMESQGRAFIPHAHVKVHAAMGLRLRELRQLFDAPDEQLQSRLNDYTTALLDAAASIQYDCVREAGRQWGVDLPPAPFSTTQQKQSCLDGGAELDGQIRAHLIVSPAEKPGHIAREETAAAAEIREPIRSFADVPLTGAEQSLLPRYRRLGHVRSCAVRGPEDEDSGSNDSHERLDLQSDDQGCVVAYFLPTGA